MAKKKKTVNPDAVYKNGMHVERTNQCLLQGVKILAFMGVVGVFSYIVSMIPAGLFGVAIAKENTTTQSVYDIQNIVLALIGLVIFAIGGRIIGKMAGENDAMLAYRYSLARTPDMKYLLIPIGMAVLVFMIIGVVMNIDFFAGPAKYLGIFFCRAERRINEGIKVPFIHRLLAMLICMAVETPMMIKGAVDGFREKMSSLESVEADEKAREAERAAAEAAANAKERK